MNRKTKISLILFTLVLVSIAFYLYKPTRGVKESVAFENAGALVHKWNKFILDLERNTPGYRPPTSARMFAYVGMCAYETSVPSLNGYHSLSGKIIPEKFAVAVPEKYDLSIALNAAYSQILRQFFATAPFTQLRDLEQMEKENLLKAEKNFDASTKEISISFGKAVADAIWAYSATDSVAHNAHLYNYDKNYVLPTGKGAWQPYNIHSSPPLLPYWGNARTFILPQNQNFYKAPIAFDETPSSTFYSEAMEVYLSSQNRTYEDVWIAEFWSDDLPQLTITPVGRWFSILNQYFDENKSTFEQMLSSYLKLGLGMNDASVMCWRAKYKYNLERPETFIQKHIDSKWIPLHDSPNFPSYPSGHSSFGAVASEILKSSLGDIHKFTDKTHEKRTEFIGKPRTFNSFDELAKENAFSRIKIGVHYRMDCEEGFRAGKEMGKILANFSLKSDIVLKK